MRKSALSPDEAKVCGSHAAVSRAARNLELPVQLVHSHHTDRNGSAFLDNMEESKSLLGDHQDENEFSSSESFDGDGHYRKPPKSSYLRVVLVVYFITVHSYCALW